MANIKTNRQQPVTTLVTNAILTLFMVNPPQSAEVKVPANQQARRATARIVTAIYLGFALLTIAALYVFILIAVDTGGMLYYFTGFALLILFIRSLTLSVRQWKSLI